MKAFVREIDNVVVWYADQAVEVEGGNWSDGQTVFVDRLYVIDVTVVTDDMKKYPQSMKVLDGTLVRNPDYVSFKSTEDKVQEMENRLQATEDALLQLMLGGGGI